MTTHFATKPVLTISVFLFLINISSIAQKKIEFDFKDFTSVEIGGAFVAEITQGSDYRIVVECEESVAKHVSVTKNDGELVAVMKESSGGSTGDRKAMIYITLPSLSDLEVSGASFVKIVGIKMSAMEVELSGASSIKGIFEVDKMDLNISGASQLKAEGKISNLELEIEGASSIEGGNLEVTGELHLESSGASRTELLVAGKMYLEMSGASTMVYSGDGIIASQEIKGASTVKKK